MSSYSHGVSTGSTLQRLALACWKPLRLVSQSSASSFDELEVRVSRASQRSDQLVIAFYAFGTSCDVRTMQLHAPSQFAACWASDRFAECFTFDLARFCNRCYGLRYRPLDLSKVVCACALTPLWLAKLCCAYIEARACAYVSITQASATAAAHTCILRCASCQDTWHDMAWYYTLRYLWESACG